MTLDAVEKILLRAAREFHLSSDFDRQRDRTRHSTFRLSAGDQHQPRA